MFDATPGEHIYLSTACAHRCHLDCLPCEYCVADCVCPCHIRPKEPTHD